MPQLLLSVHRQHTNFWHRAHVINREVCVCVSESCRLMNVSLTHSTAVVSRANVTLTLCLSVLFYEPILFFARTYSVQMLCYVQNVQNMQFKYIFKPFINKNKIHCKYTSLGQRFSTGASDRVTDSKKKKTMLKTNKIQMTI